MQVSYCSLMTTVSGTDVVKLCNTEVSIRGAVPPHSHVLCTVRKGQVLMLGVCLDYVRYRVLTA